MAGCSGKLVRTLHPKGLNSEVINCERQGYSVSGPGVGSLCLRCVVPGYQTALSQQPAVSLCPDAATVPTPKQVDCHRH